MALETLKDIKKIGGYDVEHGPQEEQGNWPFAETPVYVDHKENIIMFKIQDGPIKEVGVNGCQLDTLIYAARMMLEGLNYKFPCRENSIAITKLDEATHWLRARTRDREERGVEGFSKA